MFYDFSKFINYWLIPQKGLFYVTMHGYRFIDLSGFSKLFSALFTTKVSAKDLTFIAFYNYFEIDLIFFSGFISTNFETYVPYSGIHTTFSVIFKF